MAFAAKAIPKMMTHLMSGMMQNMMSNMSESGCDPTEMRQRMFAGFVEAPKEK